MTLGTREAMIIAAERRFALHGLEGVSLRQIAIDSGQRNESAAHYHFGSREGLIKAILEYRVPKMNVRREKWLNEKSSSSNIRSDRLAASTLVYPMAEEIFSHWRACYWVRFISQLFSIEKLRALIEDLEVLAPAFTAAYDLIETVPGIDRRVLSIRREILKQDVVWGLARVEAMSFHEDRALCELHVANLVDMIAAGISAPPSPETLLKADAMLN